MGIFLAIIGLLNKIMDFLNPWSAYWVNKSKDSDVKRAEAKKRMDDAAKKGDYDAFLDGRSDRDCA